MPVKSGERNRFITLDAILPPFHRDIDMGDWIFVIEKRAGNPPEEARQIYSERYDETDAHSDRARQV